MSLPTAQFLSRATADQCRFVVQLASLRILPAVVDKLWEHYIPKGTDSPLDPTHKVQLFCLV